MEPIVRSKLFVQKKIIKLIFPQRNQTNFWCTIVAATDINELLSKAEIMSVTQDYSPIRQT